MFLQVWTEGLLLSRVNDVCVLGRVVVQDAGGGGAGGEQVQRDRHSVSVKGTEEPRHIWSLVIDAVFPGR